MVGMLLVLYVSCMLIWPWSDPRSRSRSRGEHPSGVFYYLCVFCCMLL